MKSLAVVGGAATTAAGMLGSARLFLAAKSQLESQKLSWRPLVSTSGRAGRAARLGKAVLFSAVRRGFVRNGDGREPPRNVTERSPARNRSLVSSFQMSFEDDAVEPLAVESAEHFAELVRRAHAPEAGRNAEQSRERAEARRRLPRELGS